MFEPPPNGMTTASAASAAREDRRDLLLVAGPDDDVGSRPMLAAPVAHQVAQALAAGVDARGRGRRRDVLGADGRLESARSSPVDARRGDAQIVERDRRRRRRRDVDPEVR